jgi:hypothetical protein
MGVMLRASTAPGETGSTSRNLPWSGIYATADDRYSRSRDARAILTMLYPNVTATADAIASPTGLPSNTNR